MNKITRVKALVLEHIRQGKYPAGSRLPSLRELARDTGVHVNTASLVYRELAEQGIVRSEHGKGTFVLQTPDERHLPSNRELIRTELNRLTRRAFEAGIGPEEFMDLAGKATKANAVHEPLRIGFVECNRFDTEDVAAAIASLLQTNITPLLTDELRDKSFMENTDLLLTTPFHIDEVEASVGADVPVIMLNVVPSIQTLVELARIPEESRVAVVGSNAATLKRLEDMVLIHTRREPAAACLASSGKLAEVLQQADTVVDSQSIHSSVLKLSPGMKTVTVRFEPEINSVEFLRARLKDLFPKRFNTDEPFEPRYANRRR